MSSPHISNERKRRRSSSSSSSSVSVDNEDPSSSSQRSNTLVTHPLAALPSPMISNSAPPSQPIAYYPVYTTHTGHLYIASPPLHPTSSHPTKILPKLPHTFQTPPSPVALSPASTPFYHPYQPPITPPSALPPSSHYSTADQREQARKVSHSAIERRRRERINDKIMQLKQLIPTCAKQDHLHKMSILQSAIDYITFLKEIVESNEKAQNASPLKPKDLLSSKKSASTVTPSEAGTIPTNMSVKNLLC